MGSHSTATLLKLVIYNLNDFISCQDIASRNIYMSVIFITVLLMDLIFDIVSN